MKAYRRYSTERQMALSLGVFVALMLLLESGGLYDWARRLELGPERSVALPLATGLHRALAPLGIERERERALVELARVGWSDDPAALAAANPPASVVPAHSSTLAIRAAVPAASVKSACGCAHSAAACACVGGVAAYVERAAEDSCR